MSAKSAPSGFRPCLREPNVRHAADYGICNCLLTEPEKLRRQMANCPNRGVSCLACDGIKARLRLLDAPKLDLAALPETVPVEHQALSSGALGAPERNHTCETCGGLGEVSIYPCRVCLGTGELTASGVPAGGAS